MKFDWILKIFCGRRDAHAELVDLWVITYRYFKAHICNAVLISLCREKIIIKQTHENFY